MALPQAQEKALAEIVEMLNLELRENFRTCLLYGSAVRGNWVSGVSDINLLIVLQESTP